MSKPFYHHKKILPLLACQLCIFFASAQKVYFVDGFHGGIYGHYPKQYTAFINQTLQKTPAWNINLEIEPETWDSVKAKEPENYATFKRYFEDQSDNGRIEYVNPAYGQPYMYNINGESIIRQFSVGIKKMHSHFPNALFTSYSSEEPCFTSALPQILTSFGFKYASLKNPNTCWGGYTRAFGRETVNWIGPDGTSILTVPRYAVEALETKSTWQTTASENSDDYLQSALKNGIANPVGMCLQDAGWRFGPWLERRTKTYPTAYVTWRNYLNNIAAKNTKQNWNLSQEDVHVSLVWGAQVLQQIAKQVRVSENKITAAEKLATMAKLYKNSAWPADAFDEAWRGILLAQHHDCWIVPYNGRKGNTWIDKVAVWTGTADRTADSSINLSMRALAEQATGTGKYFVRVFNTAGSKRREFVKLLLPDGFNNPSILDKNNKSVRSQIIAEGPTVKAIVFEASVPSMGYNTYQLIQITPAAVTDHSIGLQANGLYALETDFYRITIDPARGGIIKSLVAKKLGNKEFVDKNAARGFNELRGYFFKDSSFFSSTDNLATVSVIEDGPLCSKIAIKGTVNRQPFTQTITVFAGQPLIDMKIRIDWVGNPGIGDDYKQKGGYRAEDFRKAFYNDSAKLQTLFALNLNNQKVYKNAPFDVTESKLTNTYFQTWDSIKNNVLLNWVDITDGSGNYGLALFSDHTTNYSHGQDNVLGITTQYSGVGLWGRNYSLTGPTEFSYAILPHKGKWDESNIWAANTNWNNSMPSILFKNDDAMKGAERSLIQCSDSSIEITAVVAEGDDLIVRLFNPKTKASAMKLSFDGSAKSIDIVELNGGPKQSLVQVPTKLKGKAVNFNIPKFGIRTLHIKGFKALQ